MVSKLAIQGFLARDPDSEQFLKTWCHIGKEANSETPNDRNKTYAAEIILNLVPFSFKGNLYRFIGNLIAHSTFL